MKNIISIIVTIISLAAFVLIVQPQYAAIKDMQVRGGQLEGVLDNARKLQSLRDSLLEKRNEIANSDIRRLEKLIPESADNVKLILEFEQIADRYGLSIQAASTTKEDESGEQQAQNFDIESKDYGIITLDFTINGGYAEFISFLKDVEKNLRITDIREFSITPPTGLEADYSFNLTIDTYWLKDNI
ncbi:type 4a pilus biogenesis protein PilO [Patescibacteria group bacterium]|nr:type 4a pilus biogenesis protein PilO [Patescibacteria group bacterium]